MNKIKDVYIIHHSHTDIGYTDLQETVIFHQIHHIRKAMEKAMLKTVRKKISDGTVRLISAWNVSWKTPGKKNAPDSLIW